MAQAIRCRWVLEKREEIQAAENPDFREISDQEEDPPAESDPFIPYDQMDMFADDIFDHNEPFDEEPSSATNPGPINQHAHVDDAPDEADPEFHDNNSRARIEDELDQEYIYFREFPGAGKVHRTDGKIHDAYSGAMKHPENPFYPFASQLDWEIARWANEDGPGQAAFTRLLNIDGVSYTDSYESQFHWLRHIQVKEKLQLSYNNSRSLNQTINELPTLAEWNRYELQLDNSGAAEPIELWCRNPVDALRSLWGSPVLLPFLKVAPEKQYSDAKMDKCLYNKMNTGNWWWNKQVTTNPSRYKLIIIKLICNHFIGSIT